MRFPPRPAALASFLLLLAACAAEPPGPAPEAVAAAAAPIVNGAPHAGDPAVVFLDLGVGTCSGTLIAPTVVLTARHCVEGIPYGDITVYFGNGQPGFFDSRVETTHHFHPSADIAVVLLGEPAPAEITPIPVGSVDLGRHHGEAVRLVGFGVTSESGTDAGVKRLGTTTLQSTSSTILFLGTQPSNTCYGDSGGPVFMSFYGFEFVVGAVSFGQGPCGTVSGSVRTDAFTDWLAGFADIRWDTSPPVVTFVEPAGPLAPGAKLEVEASDDHGVENVALFVDGQAQSTDLFAPYELALPDNLAAGEHTVEAVARDVGDNETTATLVITIPTACTRDEDCEAGLACAEGVCAGALGSTCDSPSDCASGVCFAPLGSDDPPFCSQACGGDDACPGGFDCVAPPGTPAKKCVPAEGDGGPCAIVSPAARRGAGPAPAATLLAVAGLAALGLIRRRSRRPT